MNIKYKKTQIPTATSEVLGAKPGYYTQLHPGGGGQTTQATLLPDGWTGPYPHPTKGPASPSSENEQENLFPIFTPSCSSTSPAWISCLVSYWFLLIKESKDPGQ